MEKVEILLPNDIYVPEYANLKVSDLTRLLPGTNFNKPINVYIGNQLNEGLGKYV